MSPQLNGRVFPEWRRREGDSHSIGAQREHTFAARTRSPPAVAPHLAFGMSPSSIVAVMPGSSAEPLPQAPMPS